MNPEVDLISYALGSAAVILGGIGAIALLQVMRTYRTQTDQPITPEKHANINHINASAEVPLQQCPASPSCDRRNSNEVYVSDALRRLDKSHYVVIDDVQLKSRNGRINSVQIDHIVVSNFGIFVVETKGQRGYIFGSKGDRRWTQCRFNGERKSFINPERQNYGHVLALTHLLRWKSTRRIQSVCIFPYASMLNLKDAEHTYDMQGALRYISSFHEEVYTNQQVNDIVALIMAANQISDYEREKHITQITALIPQ